MSKKYDAEPRFDSKPHKVFKIGMITEKVNNAIKKALIEKKESIKDIEDAELIIVIDKRNRHSILTSEPPETPQFTDSGDGGSSSQCYRRDQNDCLWLYTCELTSNGELVHAYRTCKSRSPCPKGTIVDLPAPCPCNDEEG
jgi:hypothetical protein